MISIRPILEITIRFRKLLGPDKLALWGWRGYSEFDPKFIRPGVLFLVL